MTAVEEFILAWVHKTISQEVSPSKSLFENISFDSLMFSQLISSIEQEFDLEISFENLDDWSSVVTPNGLAKHICVLKSGDCALEGE